MKFQVEINIPKQQDGENRVGFIISSRSQDQNKKDAVNDCIQRIDDILHGRYQEPMEENEDSLVESGKSGIGVSGTGLGRKLPDCSLNQIS